MASNIEEIDTTFESIKKIKEFLNNLIKKTNRPHRVVRSSSSYYHASCRVEDCNFTARFNRRADKLFRLTLYRNHTCEQTKFNVKRSLIKSKMEDIYKNLDGVKPKDCLSILKDQFGLHATYHSVWRSLNDLKTTKESVAITFSLAEIEKFLIWNANNNPETITDLKKSEDKLENLFICLNISRKAFEIALPVIGISLLCVENSHFVLTAFGYDGENNNLPLAISIIQLVNEESITYFLEYLELSLNLNKKEGLIIIYDYRMKNLQAVINQLLPKVAQAYCITSLSDEVNSIYQENLKTFILRTAQSENREDYNSMMDVLKTKSPLIHDFLNEIPHKYWVEYALPISRYGNLVLHTYKFSLKDPFRCLIDFVNQTGQLFCDRSLNISSNLAINEKTYTQNASDELDKISREAENLNVFMTTVKGVYRISKDRSIDYLFRVVNLAEKSCSCNLPKRKKAFPCAHMMAAIKHSKDSIENYVGNYYKLQTIKEMYSLEFYFCDIEAMKAETEMPSCSKLIKEEF